MSMDYAVGKRALGLCDRCGRKFLLLELKKQVINQVQTEIKVCEDCLDEDHPQLQLGRYPVFDPQALRDPRVDQRNDVTNTPQLTGYLSFGIPVFTTFVTPPVGGVSANGATSTLRRS